MEKSSEALDPDEFAAYCSAYDEGQEFDLDFPPEKMDAYDGLRQLLETAFMAKDPPPKIVLEATATFGVGAEFFQKLMLGWRAADSNVFGDLFGDCKYLKSVIRDGTLFGPPFARTEDDDANMAQAVLDRGCDGKGIAGVFAAWFDR